LVLEAIDVRRSRERMWAAAGGSLVACVLFGAIGGQTLARYTVGTVNPFYFEQRWRDLPAPAPLAAEMTSGAQAVSDAYVARVRPDWLYGPPPAPAVPPRPAVEERWDDEVELAVAEPEPRIMRAVEPIAMVEEAPSAEVDETDVAAAGDTATSAPEPAATPEPPAL
jgi:hypothetical protein